MRLSKIDNELSIYKKNEIIIFGAGSAARTIYNMLSSFEIEISFFCDNNPDLWNKKMYGIEIISPDVLKQKYSDNCLIQIGSSYETEIEKQLLEQGIDNYISYSEAKVRLMNLKKYRYFKEKPSVYNSYIKKVPLTDNIPIPRLWDWIIHPCFDNSKACFLALMPPKTGDSTLAETARKYGVYLENLRHSPFYFTEDVRKLIGNKPIKIITAIREPISQNMSCLYKALDDACWDNDAYWINGGDLDSIFKIWVEDAENAVKGMPSAYIPDGQFDRREKDMENAEGENKFLIQLYREVHKILFIQHFFEIAFKESLNIDIFKYPFNKEQGWDIIKAEGMEIFIYQLEKLNTIYPKLFEFLDITDEGARLVLDNVTEEKWNGSYYKEALRSIHFSNDYFDACYNAPYVKHFYSNEDIEKFKDKWRPHIEK